MSDEKELQEKSIDEKKDPVITVEGLYVSFGKHLVLEDINFQIMAGSFLAIIGPNGSGKSTLIKAILGLVRPTSGRIKLLGRELGEFHQWWRIGYVPQKAIHVDPIFPITVREVVGLGRAAWKKYPRWLGKGDREKIMEALGKVHMETFAHRRLTELSGGQQQRVFIARAIVNEPDVLFLDEPTTGVDVKAQDEFYDLLGGLNDHGITIVMVTHDIGVLNKHVKQVACLNRTLVFHGSHDEFCSSREVMAKILGENHLIGHRH